MATSAHIPYESNPRQKHQFFTEVSLGKIIFRGVFENDHYDFNSFYIKYLPNGAIDFEKTKFDRNGTDESTFANFFAKIF